MSSIRGSCWTLVRRILDQQSKLLLALMVALVGFEVLLIHVGHTMETGPGLREFLAQLPDFIHKIVGTQLENISFKVVVAFGFEHPAMLIPSIGIVIFFATIPAGERDSGLTDLWLARSISRRQYFGAHLICVGIAALVLPACALLGSAIGLATVEAAGELPWTRYIVCALNLSVLLVAIGGCTLLVTSEAQRRGTAITWILGALLPLSFIEVLAGLSALLDWVSPISPFHYFHPVTSLIEERYEVLDLGVLLVLAAVTTWMAFWRFERRDL